MGLFTQHIAKNFSKPLNNFFGRSLLKGMNRGHAPFIARCIHNYIQPDGRENILDVGCGGGNAIALFLPLTEGKVFGIDHSPTSVKVALRKNRHAVRAGRVQVVEANVSAIPFPDETFDIVSAFETVYFWLNLEEGFREVARILRPDEYFFVGNEISCEADGKRYEKSIPLFRFHPQEEIMEALSKAGFVDIVPHLDEGQRGICFAARKAREQQKSEFSSL